MRKRFQLSPKLEEQLLRMSARQIDPDSKRASGG
jgi:hypothetical protein